MAQISVRPAKDADPVQFEVDLPELDENDPQAFIDFAEANWSDEETGKSGTAVLCANARSAIVVSAQSAARSLLAKVGEGENDITIAEAHTRMADWTPQIRRAGKSNMDKATDLFGKLSEEEKEAFLQQLQD